MQQIISGKKGSNRVALFCTAGVLIGLFSHLYEKDTFFITKGILGLPYKISEAIYQFMIGTDAADAEETLANLNTDFFPHSLIATGMARWITPMLIGLFLVGSFAYFTGDKKIFTLQRYTHFLYGNIIVIAMLICLTYGINKKAVSDCGELKDINTFVFQSSQMISEEFSGKSAQTLKDSLQKGLKKDPRITRNYEDEIEIGLIMGNKTRFTDAYVNPQKCYIVINDITIYHVDKKFANYVKQYKISGDIPEFRKL